MTSHSAFAVRYGLKEVDGSLRWTASLGLFVLTLAIGGLSAYARWSSPAAKAHLQAQHEEILKSVRARMPADKAAKAKIIIPDESVSPTQRAGRRMRVIALRTMGISVVCWMVLSVMLVRTGIKYLSVLGVVTTAAAIVATGDLAGTALIYCTDQFIERPFGFAPIVSAVGFSGKWANLVGGIDFLSVAAVVIMARGFGGVFGVSRTALLVAFLTLYVLLTLAPGLLPGLH